MNLGDILEGGQGRRKRLDEGVGEALKYYLGPTGIPERVAMLGEILNPVVGMEQASTASQQMMDPSKSLWDRVGAGGRMATEIAGVAAPMGAARMAGVGSDDAARAIQEALTGFSASPGTVAAKDFAADEAGAIRAWHGSPHDFDKFNMDKIGTGEGAQAYGHGLYFAESDKVAKEYRDALAATHRDTFRDPPLFDALDRKPSKFIDVDTQRAIARNGPGEASDRIKKIRREVAELQKQMEEEPELAPVIEGMISSYDGEVVELNQILAKGHANNYPYGGRLYEVEIDANPEDFLDWDAPLSEQPRILEQFGYEEAKYPEDWIQDVNMTGAELYRQYSGPTSDGARGGYSGLPENQLASGQSRPIRAKDGSIIDRPLRIPGIRYLDQGSRGAGDGTRNYVVFDDNLVSIIKKYGIAGAAAMLGMSAEELQAQADEQGQLSLKDYLGK